MTPLVCLTIAGSDSGGGAGLQADLRTWAALGVHGTTAVTAVTAQSTRGVASMVPLDVGAVVDQIEEVLADFDVVAVKTGVLATPAIVAAVADLAAAGRLPNLVVDPVLVATSGDALSTEGVVEAYRDLLLPRCTVATPNGREAAALTGLPVGTLAERRLAASALGEMAPAVIVTGGDPDPDPDSDSGHGPDPDGAAAPWGEVVDLAARGSALVELRHPRQAGANTHGSGCTFSAALAAGLALGMDLMAAAGAAQRFCAVAIAGGAGWRLGAGSGPLDHLGWSPGGGEPPAAAFAGP